jgi:hypothetical protein
MARLISKQVRHGLRRETVHQRGAFGYFRRVLRRTAFLTYGNPELSHRSTSVSFFFGMFRRCTWFPSEPFAVLWNYYQMSSRDKRDSGLEARA